MLIDTKYAIKKFCKKIPKISQKGGRGVAKDGKFPIIFYDMVPYEKAPTLPYRDRRLRVAERWLISPGGGGA